MDNSLKVINKMTWSTWSYVGACVGLYVIYKYFISKPKRKQREITKEFNVKTIEEFLSVLYNYFKENDLEENVYISIDREQLQYTIKIQNKQIPSEDEVQTTWRRFEELFPRGDNKLANFSRVFQKITNKTPLTRELLKKIMLHHSNITLEELSLRAESEFPDKNFNELSISELDEIYSKLLLSDNLNHLTLSPTPLIPFYDKAKTSGKGEIGKMETTYVILQHWFTIVKKINFFHLSYKDQLLEEYDNEDNNNNNNNDNNDNDDNREHFSNNQIESIKHKEIIRDAEFLTSRMADREPLLGTLVRLSTGYYVYSEIFLSWGACISLLEDIQHKNEPIFACRGTRMNYSASSNLLSGVNDLLVYIGSLGIRKNWPSILKSIQSKNYQSYQVCGKSLGGAFAQLLTLKLQRETKFRVSTLITICSVGVSKYFNSLFMTSLENSQLILHVRNGGIDEEYDYVPHIGGVLFGYNYGLYNPPLGWHVYLYYLTKENHHHLHDLSVIKGIILLFASLGKSHTRQSTLANYLPLKVAKEHLNEELTKGEVLERYRQIIAFFFNILTFGLLNGNPVQ